MKTFSLCMIVKDEEKTLARCLNSVKEIMDEIIIVDTGSSDRTREVAARFTDKIFAFPWSDDFSAARNYSFGRASMDYIMWLDADDIVLPGDAVKLKTLKGELADQVNVVMMRYNTVFDEQGNVVFSYSRERLVKRTCRFQWREPVHEYIETCGQYLNADIAVTHARPADRPGSNRNIQIYEHIIASGQELSARGIYYYARELKDNERWEDAVRRFEQFLDEGRGWVEDNISACGELARCYLALQNEGKALAAMLRSFDFDTPRAEICCQIAYLFMNRLDYRQAACWFELALNLKKPQNSWGFFQQDYWGYIPSLECAVCYDKLGDYEKAASFNDRAAEFKPDSPAVLHNKIYFRNRTDASKDQ